MGFRVVGLDPSLAATGVADADGRLWVLKQRPKDGDERLVNIYEAVSVHIHGADLVVMEDLPRNAMGAGVTGMVQGVCRLALREMGIPYITITPATLKKAATSKGNAKKPDMRAAWLRFSGNDVADDNKVDAAFLREIGEHLTGGDSWLTDLDCIEPLREQVDAILAGYVLN